MKRFKKNKYKINIIFISIFLIVILSFKILIIINNKITPKLIDISKNTIEVYNNKLIMNFISTDSLYKSELNDLIRIVKNKNDEIISIDYDMDESYKVLKNITNELYSIINNTSYKDITDYNYDIKEDLILYYPIGLVTDYIFFNNFGPKIPVKIKFLNSLVIGLNTKVSNYGINNALVEIYINIEIVDKIVIPFKEDNISNSYTMLLSSKLIMGQVPSFLGGTIQNQSPIVSNN